jgi:hypothetical protein
MTFLKILVNGATTILKHDNYLALSFASMGVMVAISLFLLQFLARFNQTIEEKRHGLLLKNVKRSNEVSWFYFPSFLLKRIAYISIPFVFEH